MDWITTVAGNASLISAIIAITAGALVVWRTGSIHPINTRLLRLFISRDEVEDPVIRQSLADQAALSSFRMTHGIKVETISDARRLANFGNEKNISLHLVGRAGDTFDVSTLSMVQTKVPSKWMLPIPMILTLAVWVLICGLGLLAASDNLLVSLKKTETWLFISDSQASLAFPPFFSERAQVSIDSCKRGSESPSLPEGFNQRDSEILCKVWSDPSLKTYLESEVPKQRRAAIVAIVFLGIAFLFLVATIRHWAAAIRLNRLLGPGKASRPTKKLRRFGLQKSSKN
jgi:hypothetical protein